MIYILLRFHYSANMRSRKATKFTFTGLMISMSRTRTASAWHYVEINISQKTLARLTGIAPSTLSRYLSGKRKMQYDYLCAVCIAIRLHPFRQRYLFSLLLYAMPGDQDYRKADKNIIRAYLDGCAFDKRYTLTACNEQLKAIHTKPLTNLTSAKEDSE